MSLDDVVSSLATGTYTVSRRSAGTYDANGQYVDGSISTLTISASCQPLSGRELQRLPEGARNRESRVFYTRTELKSVDGVTGAPPDVVEVPGVGFFEVHLVEDRSTSGFWRVVGLMLQEGTTLPAPGTASPGDRTITGNLEVTGDLTVDGLTKVDARPTTAFPTAGAGNTGALLFDTTAGTLKVSDGASWVPAGGVTEPLTLADPLTITGEDADQNSLILPVDGYVSFGTGPSAPFIGPGAVSMPGTQATFNTVNLSSTLNAAGPVIADNIQSRTGGAFSINSSGQADFASNLSVGGNASVTGALTVVGDASVTGSLSTGGSLVAKASDLTAHISATSAHGVTGAVVGTTDTQTLANKTFSDTVKASAFSALANAALSLLSLVTDGATAVGIILDTQNALANAAAKLVSIRTAGVEKLFVGRDGGLTILGVASGGYGITLPDATYINWGATNKCYYNSGIGYFQFSKGIIVDGANGIALNGGSYGTPGAASPQRSRAAKPMARRR
jgi:hypothetical protein